MIVKASVDSSQSVFELLMRRRTEKQSPPWGLVTCAERGILVAIKRIVSAETLGLLSGSCAIKRTPRFWAASSGYSQVCPA